MRIIIKFTLILILLLPGFFVNAAQPLIIKINGESFKPSDNVKVEAEFTNTYSIPIKGYATCGFVSQDPNYQPFPKRINIDLIPGKSKKDINCNMSVAEDNPKGLYQALVEVYDENNSLVATDYKEFIISGTKNNIGADLLICEDNIRDKNKAVFIKGETVYLKLKTNIADLQIKAWSQNNKTEEKQDITFANNIAEIKA